MSPLAPDEDFAIQTFSLRLLANASSFSLSSTYFALNFIIDSDFDLSCAGKMIKETGIH